MQNKKKYDVLIAITLIAVIGLIVYYLKTNYLTKNPIIKYKTKVEIINKKIEEYEIEINKLKLINDSLQTLIDKRSTKILILRGNRDNIKIDSIKRDSEVLFVIDYLKNIKI